MKEVVIEKDIRSDPILVAIDTPADKLPQFTIIPTGGVNAFAMSKTIQQFGKPDSFDGLTPMEYYMNKIFEYNRSRGGVMLAGLMKLAQTKAESAVSREADARRYVV